MVDGYMEMRERIVDTEAFNPFYDKSTDWRGFTDNVPTWEDLFLSFM